MLCQQQLENAVWSASGQSQIRLNRIAREVNGQRAHIAGLMFKLDLTITAGGAGVDTTGASMFNAIDEIRITDGVNVDIVRLKGHQLRTLLKMLTGRLSGGFADPAVVAAAGGAGVARTVRFMLPFVGESGVLPAGIMGLRRWSDALQPVDRFLSDNALVTINWGVAACLNAGTVTAATLTVTPFTIGLPELHQGMDLRINYQSQAAAQRFDLSLKGIKVLCFGFTNPDLDHSDYTELNLGNGLLVKATPVERIAMFNATCIRDAVENISLTAPDVLPVIFTPPGFGATKLTGYGYPASVQLETVTTHATAQWAAYAEIFDRAQLVENLVAARLGDYGLVKLQLPKYEGKNGRRVGAGKGQVFDRIGPAKLMRQ